MIDYEKLKERISKHRDDVTNLGFLLALDLIVKDMDNIRNTPATKNSCENVGAECQHEYPFGIDFKSQSAKCLKCGGFYR